MGSEVKLTWVRVLFSTWMSRVKSVTPPKAFTFSVQNKDDPIRSS